MLPSKPALLFSTYTSLSALPASSSCCLSSSSLSPSTRSHPDRMRYPLPVRLYSSSSSSSSHPSPQSWPTSTHPTPYEIFGYTQPHPRASPQNYTYSKQRFYELVKLYHPDRCQYHHHSRHHSHQLTPRHILIERYRLVVAANTILSDPARRRAYDAYGAGWNGIPDLRHDGNMAAGGGMGADAWAASAAAAQRSGWRSREDSPAYNATWEDWEKWYARREVREREERRRTRARAAAERAAEAEAQTRGMDGTAMGDDGGAGGEAWAQKSGPIYASNMAFVSLVVLFAALAGVGQATRAESFSSDLSLKRDIVHQYCSKELIRRRDSTATRLGGREESVEAFLRDRENAAYGFVDDSERTDEEEEEEKETQSGSSGDSSRPI